MKTIQITTKISFTVPARYVSVHDDSIVLSMDYVPVFAVIQKHHTEEVETSWVRNDQKVLLGAEVIVYMDDVVSSLHWYQIANVIEKEYRFDDGKPGFNAIMQELALLADHSD